MRYATEAGIPSAYARGGRIYDGVDTSVWVTPRQRGLDGSSALQLTATASLLIANGTSGAPASDSGISGKISRSNRAISVDILSTDATDAGGAYRSQINLNKVYRPPYYTPLVWTTRFRLNSWNTATANARVNIAQLKDIEDTHLGESGRQGPLALIVNQANLEVHVRVDANALTSGGSIPVSETLTGATVVTDTWHTASLEFYNTKGEGGYCRFYFDGTLVDETAGAVGVNDRSAPYLAYGLYCFDGFNGLPGRSATFHGSCISSESRQALEAAMAVAASL